VSYADSFQSPPRKFAQALAEGKPASAAYEEAGYSRNDGNAVRLKGNEKVQSRVSELQERGAERAVVTLQSLIAVSTCCEGNLASLAADAGHANPIGVGYKLVQQ
jgi:hypothetical protein